MKQLASAILAVAFLTVPANGSNGKLESKLSVSESLPGMPFDLSLSLHGATDGPTDLALHVRPTVGDPFFANYSGDYLFVPLKRGSRLRGGDSHTIPVGRGLAEDGWLFDSRLWQPGEYHLRLVSSDAFYEGDLVDGKAPTDAVWGNDMTFTVKAPQGDEAKSWNAIMEATKGHGFGRVSNRHVIGIARALVEKGPDSVYTPFLLLKANPPLDEIDEVIAKAQKIDPASPGTEALQLQRALLLSDVAMRGSQQAHRLDVKEKWERAEHALESVAKTAKSRLIRERAATYLNERRGLRARFAESAAEHQEP